MPLKLIYTIVDAAVTIEWHLTVHVSKMFLKICSVAMMSVYFGADSGTAHFAVVWFWTMKFFQTSLRFRDMNDRQQRQRVKCKLRNSITFQFREETRSGIMLCTVVVVNDPIIVKNNRLRKKRGKNRLID